MNRKSFFAATIGITLTAATLSACQSSTGAKTALPSTSSSPVITTPSSTPSSTSTSLTLPVASNPIVNNSTNPSLQITYSAVENNVDPITHNPIGDQLQLTLKNVGSTALSNVEVYYEMTDIVTKAKEGYYQKLTNLVIPAHQETTVYFDNKNQPGHYPENQFSLYRSSTNQVNFVIWVSAAGAKIAQSKATKSLSTGEKPGA